MASSRRVSSRSTVPTIRDVASEAQVSIATVSRVLRSPGVVAPATRERVLATVAQMGFTPSRLGRSLAERQHAANGIVFPDLSGPYYAEVVLGYEAAASELGRSVLILSTHGRAMARERILDLAGRVDGLVILGRTVSDEVVAEVAARGLPVVALARPGLDTDERHPVDTVNAEIHDSAHALARHLLDVGRRRPVFIGDLTGSHDVAERWRSVREAFAQDGSTATAIEAGLSESEGARVADELVRTGRIAEVDALVCANDELALGALATLDAAGVDVPTDVAVTGWDDVMAARWAGLTTVRQPMRQLGVVAAHALDARIAGDRGSARHQLLPTELVVRRTCGHLQEGTT